MIEREYKDPDKITEAMKSGLARMYADSDVREYLIHAMNIANHNVLAAVRVGKPEEAKDFAARLDTLKQLHDKGKTLYARAEELKRKPLSELVREQEHASNKEQE